MLKLAIVAIALLATSVNAYDFRVDFRPRKGQTPARFCQLWAAECQKVASKHHYRGTVYHLCEPGVPRPGIAAAYCNSQYKGKYVQYSDEVGKNLGAKVV